MKIVLGGTRLVLIFSKIVIKLPLVHIRYPFVYLFTKKEKVQERLRLGSFKKVLSYVFCGLIANRLEYLYSKNHKESEGIIKTYGLLWGLIVIQKKGEVPTETNQIWLKFLKALKKIGIQEPDTLRPCNFCIWKDRLRISDFGHKDTISALDKINLRIIERFGTN